MSNVPAILHPGNYLVELEFSRPVAEETLRGALTRMGWDVAAFDEGASPVTGMTLAQRLGGGGAAPAPAHRSIGTARPTHAAAASPAHRSIGTARPSPAAQAAAPPQRKLGTVRPSTGPAPAVMPSGKASGPSAAARAVAVPGFSTPANSKLAQPPGFSSPAPTQAQAQAPAYQTPAPASPSGGGGSNGGGGSDGGGGGGGSPDGNQAPQDDPMQQMQYAPDPSQYDPQYDQSQYQDSYAAPQGETEGGASPLDVLGDVATALQNMLPGPPPALPFPGETFSIMGLRLMNLWRRWVEWGSPFAVGPNNGVIDSNMLSQVQIAGVEEGGTRVRFIGRLTRSIQLTDAPWMRWLYVRHLSVDPFGAINSHVQPWPLATGKTYEFRIISRDRAAPRMAEVRDALARMGFAPMKISLIQRHIHLPNFPGANLSAWYGLGQWLRADTLVNREDPFVFEEVQEVVP